MQRLLDQIEAPAIVSTVHGDYLAANALGRALYAPVFDSPEQPANSGRFTFLDPAAREFYPDWERLASELVAALRSQAGRNPYDRNLQDLIGELSTRSDEFRVRWAAHNVRFHRTGTKRLHHPIVGELELSYETLTLDADDGLRLALYTAEAGSASQQALDLLASWTATPDPIEKTMTPATTPALTLNNGVTMPALGLGVFQSPPEETVTAVETALRDGYRLIDTAAAYDNEREVGEGIRRSGVDRDEIFVTTKLWISDYGYDAAQVGFEASLRRLGVDHVDLYLLHQPVPTHFDDTIGAYKAAETFLADGRARAIGVSNFSAEHLRGLIDATDVVPAVNQVELHPYFTQPALREVHAELGIATQAWSPLGGVLVYVPGADESRGPLTDPVITDLAAKYGKTPAQVVLRWHIEHGFCAIPKSVKPHRIAENFDVFDFSLTAEEVAAIDALDKGVRGGPDPEPLSPETYPKVVDNS